MSHIKITLLVTVLLSLTTLGRANDLTEEALRTHLIGMEPTSAMNLADSLYTSGDYNGALVCYQSVLSAGYHSADLLYNMGNTYFRMGETASAILYYERALVLHPGDKDATYNLEIAQGLTTDRIETIPEFFLVTWYRHLLTRHSADGWGRTVVVLFILFWVMVVLFFVTTSRGWKRAAFSLGIILLLGTASTLVFASEQRKGNDEAIVMTPSVTVLGSPDRSGSELFVIHDGLKVKITATLGDWANIRVADGHEGWILLSDIEKI